MNLTKQTERHIAFLRGINVGGHHKVPMADLRIVFEELKFENVVTLLNSGNVIFDTAVNDQEDLEILISEKLENTFGFHIPTIIRKSKTINELYEAAPFQSVTIDKNIRLYVSFLKNDDASDLELPWTSPDSSYKIVQKKDRVILSILDLSVSQTPDAMKFLEQYFGKNITTRNWKTIERIIKKL